MDKKDLIRRLLAVKKSKSGRYPEKLKDDVLTYTEERRSRGVSIKDIATELRMSRQTLFDWRCDAKTSHKLRRVKVKGLGTKPPTCVAKDNTIVVHFPNGMSVQELNIAQATELVRSLL